MFIDYYDTIERSSLSSEDKKTLMDFLKYLNKVKYEPDKLLNLTNEELNRVFQIAKINSKLQIEMWQMLPDEIVNDFENTKIFENVLDNRFGEYINGIDKSALLRVLNSSRLPSRIS